MTTLLQSGRLGVQRPVYLHLPPEMVSSAGDEAIRLAESVGLDLDDWQRWVLENALAERQDGKWSAFECALICPRQNGKGAILEALELAALFLFECRLIVHSAHQFPTAVEHFLRIQTLIENSDDLRKKLRKNGIRTANGQEAIILKSGARLKFVARSKGAARGFTGDLLIMDEAYDLPVQAIGAMLPALSARPNPQVWYTSSAPQQDSHVLHAIRRRGLEGNAGRFFWAEWGNPPDCDPLDDEARARANPAKNIRISDEFINDEYRSMHGLGDEFMRERMGVPSEEDSGAGVFPPAVWAACTDPMSKPDPATACFALDVAPGMTFASFAFAAKRADGLVHLELAERRPGTEWIVPRAVEKGRVIALDPRGPAGGLLNELRAAGVNVLEMPDGQMPRSCVTLQKLVMAGNVRKLDQFELDQAVTGASISPSGDAWRWSRAHSSVDISPLVAVTIALWHLDNRKSAPHVWDLNELLGGE